MRERRERRGERGGRRERGKKADSTSYWYKSITKQGVFTSVTINQRF